MGWWGVWLCVPEGEADEDEGEEEAEEAEEEEEEEEDEDEEDIKEEEKSTSEEVCFVENTMEGEGMTSNAMALFSP